MMNRNSLGVHSEFVFVIAAYSDFASIQSSEPPVASVAQSGRVHRLNCLPILVLFRRCTYYDMW